MSASSSSGFGVDFGDGDDRNDVRLLLLLESFEVDSRLRNEPSSSSPPEMSERNFHVSI